MWSSFLLLGLLSSAARPAITEADVRETMNILAGPAMEGRLPLTAANDAAAQYVANEFKRYGLRPGGTSGFFHEFDVTINQRPTKNNVVAFTNAQGERFSLTIGTDASPVWGTDALRLVSGPVVFAGYGLKQDGWDDYANLDVKDKVVMVLRGLPPGRPAASNGQKARWAQSAGARAIVFVGPDREGGRELPTTARGQGIPADLNLVALGLTTQAFERVSGLRLADLRGKQAGGRDLSLTARLVTELEPNRGRTRNVIGVLPGRDPKLKDEVIIIGGHFDHLGWGEVGSRTGTPAIHYGADDNASGTSGMMALAKYFAQSRTNRRTYIFQAYCAEEVGLIGSNAWARDNAEILKRTQAMLNLDMIGRLRDGKLIVFGSGTSPQLAEVLKQIETPGIKLSNNPAAPSNSDHAAFVQRGVPVLFFHTDLHPEYHTERDTLDTINFPGMVQVLDYARQAIQAIDAFDQRLTFVPQATTPRAGSTRRVRVGFIPEMGDASGEGVLISGVVENSPAAAAGFRAGDRLLQFGDIALKSLEDLQRALAGATAGTTVRVVFLRGGQRQELMLTPAAPAQP